MEKTNGIGLDVILSDGSSSWVLQDAIGCMALMGRIVEVSCEKPQILALKTMELIRSNASTSFLDIRLFFREDLTWWESK